MPTPLKPYTRNEILARIKKGPTSFAELAQTRQHNSKSRKVARAICDELVAEGLVLRAYIGRHPYYLENTEAAKKLAVRQQIEEGSRYDPASGCTVWLKCSDETRGPLIRQALVNNNATSVNVRRWLFQELIGRELNGISENVTMRPVCEPGCIEPAHMIGRTRSEMLKGIPKPMSHRLAMRENMLKRWAKPSEAVEVIRSSDKSNKELAEEFGMSPSNVWAIRARKTHILQAVTPWTGLGAR